MSSRVLSSYHGTRRCERSETAITNRLRFVDLLRERLGDQVSRDFTAALQEEMAPLITKDEVQTMTSGLVDQFEARVWRIVAVVAGVMIAIQLTALGIAVAVLIAVLG